MRLTARWQPMSSIHESRVQAVTFHSRFVPALWLAVAAAGCAETGMIPPPKTAAVTVAIEDAPLWGVESVFEVEQDEDDPLGRAVGGVFSASGLIVVADRLNNRVVVADSSGRAVRTVGRTGMGPLEFIDLETIARWRGDSVFAWDARAKRYSVFSPSTGQGRTAVPQGMDTPVARALPGLGDGLWVVGVILMGPGDWRRSGRYRPQHDVGYWPGKGQVRKVASLAGPQMAGRTPVPGGAQTDLTTGDGLLFVTDGEDPMVAVVESGGLVRREISVDGFAVEITEPIRAAFVDWLRASAEAHPSGRGSAEVVDRRLEIAPLPQQIDAIGRVVFAADGTLWLGQRDVPGTDKRHWINITTEGVPLRRLVTSPGPTMLDAAGDRLLFLRRDQMDSDHVEVRTIAVLN